jgi:hypothetical protein
VSAPANLDELVDAGMSDMAIARRLGVSDRTVLRWRQAAGIESKWRQPFAGVHGTMAEYRRGCRCAECRAANTAEQSAYVTQRNAALPAPRHHHAWTAEDDEILLGPGTVFQRARRAGRSYGAARQRLHVLRARLDE